MQPKVEAGLVSLATFVLLAGPLWYLLSADPATVAPYVPLVLTIAVVAGFLAGYGHRLFDRPQVTGGGSADR